jgi:hypothetical protein
MVLPLALLLAAGAVSFHYFIKPYQVKALDSSGKNIAEVYKTAQSVFRANKGRFMTSLNEFQEAYQLTEPGRYKLFIDKSTLPPKVLEVLPPDRIPVLENDAYKILIGVKNDHSGKYSFWYVDNNSAPQLLEAKVPIGALPEH